MESATVHFTVWGPEDSCCGSVSILVLKLSFFKFFVHSHLSDGVTSRQTKLSLSPTVNDTGQESGAELCQIFTVWSSLQSKYVNNICRLLQLLGTKTLLGLPLESTGELWSPDCLSYSSFNENSRRLDYIYLLMTLVSWHLITRCLTVTIGATVSNVCECIRLIQPSWLLDALQYTILVCLLRATVSSDRVCRASSVKLWTCDKGLVNTVSFLVPLSISSSRWTNEVVGNLFRS